MKIEYAGLNLKPLLSKKSLCLLLIVMLSGCAAADTGMLEFQEPAVGNSVISGSRSSSDESQTFDEERIKLEGLGVQEIEGGKKVAILGSKPISYTAFKLNDPSRLIIDIPNIDFGDLRTPLNVESNVIKKIDTHIFEEDSGNIGRVEIEMMSGVEYEIDRNGSALYVKFMKDKNSDKSALDVPFAPETNHGDEDNDETTSISSAQNFADLNHTVINNNVKEDIAVRTKGEVIEENREEFVKTASLEERMSANDDAEIQKTRKEVKDLKVAEKLLSIDVKQGGNTTEVLLKADGVIKSFDSFRMSNTERIVVDLWGVSNSLSTLVIPLETPYADRIRTGKHSDKTRVVIDLKNLESSYSIEQVPEGLLLALYEKDAKDKIKTASLKNNPQEVSKINNPDLSDGGKNIIQITDVNFEDNEDTSKVLITALDRVDYDFSKSYDGKTLALIFNNAFLPDTLQRTLDTSMLKSPAQKISSFMSKGKTDNNAMVVVRLKDEVPYEISQDDNTLTLSFQKQENVPTLPSSSEVQTMTTNKPEELVTVVTEQGKKEALELKKAAVVTSETKAKKPQVIQQLNVNKENAVSAKSGSANSKSLKNETVKNPKKVIKTVTENVSEKKKYVGRKISLDFKDADINNILRLIAEVSNLNIVAGDDVKGKVTLRLLNVPWDQALDLVLKSKSLGMVKEGNVIRIAPMTKIAKEKKDLLDDKMSEEKLEDLVVKVVPVNYSSAGELTGQVKNLLSDRGSVTVDSRTNVLIIKDIKDSIDEAEVLVQLLDAPTPQVLIEARIVEAQRNFARDLGVEWGLAGGEIGSDSFGSVFGNSNVGPSNTLTPSGFIGGGGSFAQQPNFDVSLPASGKAGSLGSIGFSFGKLTGDPWLIDLRLSAGEVSGLSKTISRPRVITLDNTEARISQGDSVPFETISDGGTNTEFIDATLDLTVTPHITPDGSVFMKIKASRNSIGTFRSASGTPSISKKEASTEIMIKDGETAVIGGIVVSDESDNDSGVPYLKKVPVLGWLFNRNSVADSQTELLIFITPKIVKDSKTG